MLWVGVCFACLHYWEGNVGQNQNGSYLDTIIIGSAIADDGGSGILEPVMIYLFIYLFSASYGGGGIRHEQQNLAFVCTSS